MPRRSCPSKQFTLGILFLLFELLAAADIAPAEENDGSSDGPAVVIRKFMHKNGLKEFTVQKTIKGNECACSCLCSLPNSPEALAQMRALRPRGPQVFSFATINFQRRTRLFEIEKQIRGNQCKCSCACAEPQEEDFPSTIGENRPQKGAAVDGAGKLVDNREEESELDNRVDNTGTGDKNGEGEPALWSTPVSREEQIPSGQHPRTSTEPAAASEMGLSTTEHPRTSSSSPSSSEANPPPPTGRIHFVGLLSGQPQTDGNDDEEDGIGKKTTVAETAETAESSSQQKSADSSLSIAATEFAISSSSSATESSADVSSSVSSSPSTERSSIQNDLENLLTKLSDEQTSTAAAENQKSTTVNGRSFTASVNEKAEESSPAPSPVSTVDETTKNSNKIANDSNNNANTVSTTLTYKPASVDAQNPLKSLWTQTKQPADSIGTSSAAAEFTGSSSSIAAAADNESKTSPVDSDNPTTATTSQAMSASTSQMPLPIRAEISAPSSSINYPLGSSSASSILTPISSSFNTNSSTEEEEESPPSSTFDPAFRANVAKLLGRLKEQLFQLRQMEQQQKENQTTDAEAAKQEKEKKEEKELLFQEDQLEVNSGIDEGNGNEKKKQETTLTGEAAADETKELQKGTTLMPSKSVPEESSQKVANKNSASGEQTSAIPTSAFDNKTQSQQSNYGRSPTTTTTSSSTSRPAFVISDDTGEDEDEEEAKKEDMTSEMPKMKFAESTAQPPLPPVVLIDANSNSGHVFTANPQPPTSTPAESTLNPLFKARVANLLNRLKEQLFRLRQAQQQQKEGASTTAPHFSTENAEETISSAKFSPITSTTTASSSATANSSSSATTVHQSRTEEMLKGLEHKLEQLKAKTIEISASNTNTSEHNISGQKNAQQGQKTKIASTTLATSSATISSSSAASSNAASFKSTTAARTSGAIGIGTLTSIVETTSAPTSKKLSTTSSSTPLTKHIQQTDSSQANTTKSTQQTTAPVNGIGTGKGTTTSAAEGEEAFAFVTESPAEAESTAAAEVGVGSGGGGGMFTATQLTGNGNGLKFGKVTQDGRLPQIHALSAGNITTIGSPMPLPSTTGRDVEMAQTTAIPAPPRREKLFPLSNDFLVDAPNRSFSSGKKPAEEEEPGRVILLPAPPQGRALFMATLGPSSASPSSSPSPASRTETSKKAATTAKEDGKDENAELNKFTLVDVPVHGWSATSPVAAIPPGQQEENQLTTLVPFVPRKFAGQQSEEFGIDGGDVGRTTAVPVPRMAGRELKKPSQQQQPVPSKNGGHRKVLVAPQAQNLIERMEQARRLREEQVKLEMMEAIRQEQLGATAEPDPFLTERRREIEQRLLQLAQEERFHRQMLERQHQQRQPNGEAKKEEETGTAAAETPQPSLTSQGPPAIRCDPVRRFIRLFRIASPRQWIAENCQFARRHFPNASCQQIGALLNECLRRDGAEDDEADQQSEEDKEDIGG